MKKLNIRKNDQVVVITGNDKGTTGRVLEVYPKAMRVLVEGVNMRKKHEKPNQTNQQGGIIDIERPVHYSNVMLIDSDNKPTRVGKRIVERGGKTTSVRYAKTNQKEI